jgi:hypothetical protein
MWSSIAAPKFRRNKKLPSSAEYMFVRNNDNHLQDYTASQARKPQCKFNELFARGHIIRGVRDAIKYNIVTK